VTDPIVAAVTAKMEARSQFGRRKYGVGLDRTDLSQLQWLIHAQEEAMDLAQYLEVLISQIGLRPDALHPALCGAAPARCSFPDGQDANLTSAGAVPNEPRDGRGHFGAGDGAD